MKKIAYCVFAQEKRKYEKNLINKENDVCIFASFSLLFTFYFVLSNLGAFSKATKFTKGAIIYIINKLLPFLTKD